MDKVLGFGRRVWFVCRVLSGIEERSIRARNVELQKKLMRMREQKAALQKVPEQMVLSEIRKVVQEMQTLTQTLTDTEKAIEEYLEPLHKEAELIANAQLEGEEKITKEMMKATYERMSYEKVASSMEQKSQDSPRNVETSVGTKEEKSRDAGT